MTNSNRFKIVTQNNNNKKIVWVGSLVERYPIRKDVSTFKGDDKTATMRKWVVIKIRVGLLSH